MQIKRLNIHLLGLMALVTTTPSCSLELPIPSPGPSSLQFVVDHERDFCQRNDRPLTNIQPGTIRDDVLDLSGCFGASYHADFGGLPFTGYEMYQFDAAAGEMQYHVMQAGVSTGWSAKFEVAAPDRITITRIPAALGGQTVAALITLEGDEMKIAYLSEDGNFLNGEAGDPDDPRVKLVFTRFACPN